MPVQYVTQRDIDVLFIAPLQECVADLQSIVRTMKANSVESLPLAITQAENAVDFLKFDFVIAEAQTKLQKHLRGKLRVRTKARPKSAPVSRRKKKPTA